MGDVVAARSITGAATCQIWRATSSTRQALDEVGLPRPGRILTKCHHRLPTRPAGAGLARMSVTHGVSGADCRIVTHHSGRRRSRPIRELTVEE